MLTVKHLATIFPINSPSARREKRIVAKLDLLLPIAVRLHGQFHSAETADLINIGAIALIQAHDVGRVATKARIRGAMLDAIRKDYRYTSRRSELVDVAAPVRRYALADLLHHLPASCSQLVQLRIDGLSRKAAAASLGMSVSRARTLELSAIERLQAVCGRRLRRAA